MLVQSHGTVKTGDTQAQRHFPPALQPAGPIPNTLTFRCKPQFQSLHSNAELSRSKTFPMAIHFHNRRAAQIENDCLRITVTVEGGHIAEILDKQTGISPLWIPRWPSIEPSTYNAANHPEYGDGPESHLLSGILGHNLCLDMFGPPSPDELAAGMTAHGEANVTAWDIDASDASLVARCVMPVAQLAFERSLRVAGHRILIEERVENLSTLDRPMAWTQHVTLGPPFLEPGSTQFRVPATRSRVLGGQTDFTWPMVPRAGRAHENLELYSPAGPAGGYSAHLLNPAEPTAWFVAYSPSMQLAFGYVWSRSDFPWLGIWDENCSRHQPPWNGHEMTRGMEFGVSPFPETRREMLERRTLFDTPCYRWLPARGTLKVEYWAAIRHATTIPESREQFEVLVQHGN